MTRAWRYAHTQRMPSLRFLHYRQRGLCAYCARPTELPPSGQPMSPDTLYASRDHLMPTSRGGDNHRPNLRMACIPCNHIKGDMLPAEWEDFMRENPEWWRRPLRSKLTAAETVEFLRHSAEQAEILIE